MTVRWGEGLVRKALANAPRDSVGTRRVRFVLAHTETLSFLDTDYHGPGYVTVAEHPNGQFDVVFVQGNRRYAH